jgi:hypothetical protein
MGLLLLEILLCSGVCWRLGLVKYENGRKMFVEFESYGQVIHSGVAQEFVGH